MDAALEARVRIVQSPANRWVKALRAASLHPPALAGAPYVAGEAPLLALEGFHLIAEAVRSGLAPTAVFLRSGEHAEALRALTHELSRAGATTASLAQTEFLVLPPALFATLVDTETPRPIAALVAAPSTDLAGLLVPGHTRHAPLLLVLAALQDPGNVGTLLRSAEAFGATGALLLTGTATPWSSKSLRAAAGSALRLPLVAVRHAGEAALLLRRHGIRSYAAVPVGGSLPHTAPLEHGSALWIGNEGAGLSEKDLQGCDARLTLAMAGPTESLNAAVAGSLLLYEASRRRAAVAGKAGAQQLEAATA